MEYPMQATGRGPNTEFSYLSFPSIITWPELARDKGEETNKESQPLAHGWPVETIINLSDSPALLLPRLHWACALPGLNAFILFLEPGASLFRSPLFVSIDSLSSSSSHIKIRAESRWYAHQLYWMFLDSMWGGGISDWSVFLSLELVGFYSSSCLGLCQHHAVFVTTAL